MRLEQSENGFFFVVADSVLFVPNPLNKGEIRMLTAPNNGQYWSLLDPKEEQRQCRM